MLMIAFLILSFLKDPSEDYTRAQFISDMEAGLVKENCGKEFYTVTPGIRFADSAADDQVRVMTPARAKEIGSDYIVVGRPITAAEDPVAAYRRCMAEFVG